MIRVRSIFFWEMGRIITFFEKAPKYLSVSYVVLGNLKYEKAAG